MGICLSCLGLRGRRGGDLESQPLFNDPYNQYGGYGTQGQGQANQHYGHSERTNSEDRQRETEALNNILKWTSDNIVDIFPHQQNAMSPVPGDKTSRSRIYPSSRPHSQASTVSRKAASHRSHPASTDGKSHTDLPQLFSALEIDVRRDGTHLASG